MKINGKIKAETDKAICIEFDGRKEWFPKSKTKVNARYSVDGYKHVKLDIPDWLADSKEIER